MSRRGLAALAAFAAVAGFAPGAEAATRLAAPMLAAESTPALLAERAIERRWGISEDTLYREVDVSGWRDETAALGLSAVVPGAGQMFAGDRLAGAVFAAAEAIGWISHLFWRGRGETLRDEAEDYAGSPEDPASAWSFERLAESSQTDPAELEAIYSGDRETFYDLIGSDPKYLAGWAGDPVATRGAYREMWGHADARLRNARYAGIALWINHVAAATHALRAARLHNVPLQPGLDLRLKTGWRDGPSMYATIERRF